MYACGGGVVLPGGRSLGTLRNFEYFNTHHRLRSTIRSNSSGGSEVSSLPHVLARSKLSSTLSTAVEALSYW